jgi:hypothetical protein
VVACAHCRTNRQRSYTTTGTSATWLRPSFQPSLRFVSKGEPTSWRRALIVINSSRPLGNEQVSRSPTTAKVTIAEQHAPPSRSIGLTCFLQLFLTMAEYGNTTGISCFKALKATREPHPKESSITEPERNYANNTVPYTVTCHRSGSRLLELRDWRALPSPEASTMVKWTSTCESVHACSDDEAVFLSAKRIIARRAIKFEQAHQHLV